MKIMNKLNDLNHSIVSYSIVLFIISSLIFCLGVMGCDKSGESTGGIGYVAIEETDTEPASDETPNPPVAINLSTDKDPVNINEIALITATITDGAGLPVAAGTKINFSIDPNDLATFTPDPNISTLNNSGTVMINLKPLKAGTGFIKAETLNGAIGTLAITIEDPGMPDETSNPPVAINLSTDKDPVGIHEIALITATITDGAGLPVAAGTKINFSIDPNDLATFTPDPNTSTLNDSGIVPINLKPIKTGIGVIKAETPNGAIGTLAITIGDTEIPGETINPPVAIHLSTDKDPVGIHEIALITATITDSAGQPVAAGTKINFSIDPNDLATFTPDPNTSTLNDSGSVMINLKPIKTGIGVIKAETPNGAIGTLAIAIGDIDVPAGPSGDPNIIILSADNMRIVADGKSQSTITAVVIDPNHHPVGDNTLVNFTLTSGSGMIDPSALTIGGFATATLTSSTTAGPVTIKASAESISQTLTLTYIPGEPAHIALIPLPNSLLPDGASQAVITALVTDDYGNKITEPPATVNFNTTLDCSITDSDKTDPNGIATAVLTSGTQQGTAKITAISGAASGQTAVNVSGLNVAKINLSADPAALDADGKSTSIITAQVMDPNNNPVSDNTPVTFIILGGSADSGIIQAGAFTSGGIAQTTYTSGTTPQTVTIQAASGGKAATLNIVLKALVPASISLAASSTTLQVGETTTAAITATVLNNVGSPVGSAIINFSTDLGGISPSDTTDPNGVAEATFTAGTVAGAATITATAGNISDTIVITLNPGSASNIVLDIAITPNPDPETIYIKGTDKSQTSTFTFEVRDENGNPVADGEQVEFVLLNNGLGGGESLKPGAGIDPNDGALTVGGQVKTTLQSGYKAGTVKVIAFIDSTNNGQPDEGEVQSAAIGIAINGGLPDGENLGVNPETLNIAGLVTLNIEDTITAMLSDRYHNPVPQGTTVYFTSDYAGITGQGIVPDSEGASAATAILTSQEPLPPDGFVTVDSSTQTGNWGRILCLARHPTYPGIILYAGTDGGGIFKTINAQSDPIHWTWIGRTETGLTNGFVRDIKIDKNQPSIVYAATDEGVFRSIGSGGQWENMGIFKETSGEAPSENGGNLNTTDADSDGLSDQTYTLDYPSNQNRAKTKVYLNGAETKHYIYINSQTISFIVGGATGLTNGAAVTIDYQTGNTLPTIHPVYALAVDSDPVDPVNDSKIYAALYGAGVYKSDNSGLTWQLKNSGMSNTDILSLTIDPTTTEPNARLYAGTWGGGIFKTTNSSTTWTSINTGLGYTVITTILVDPLNTNNIYAGTMLGGVFRSADQGTTWSPATTNVNATDVNNTYVKNLVIDTAYDPLADGTLYAGTYTEDGNSPVGGVFKSDDSGATWSRVTSMENNAILCLEIDGASGNDTLFAGTYKRLIFKSDDSGTTWNCVNSTTPDDLYHIFASTQVLFSDDTRISITPIYATYQDYGTFSTLYNTEYQTFIYTVSDINGNPLTSGSTISVAVTNGTLSGNVNETLPDLQYGNTVYQVTWTNDITDKSNKWSSLTVTVTSEDNGNLTGSVLRNLIGVLDISPASKSIEALTAPAFAAVTFTATGGSDVPANYIWTTTEGTFSASGTNTQTGGQTAILITTATENGKTFTVTVRDNETGQTAEATVTQGS